MWVWAHISSHLPVQPASGQVNVMESSYFFFLSPLKQRKKRKKVKKKKTMTTGDDSQGSTHVLSFRRTCCYGNAGCLALQVKCRRACQVDSPPVTPSAQLLHSLVGLWRMHVWWGAEDHRPPTFHVGPTFHKSTSSSPPEGRSGPRRLSSLP